MRLPDKYNTQVSPKGLQISGGQRQRVALARMFLKNPKIILLDKATAALDNQTARNTTFTCHFCKVRTTQDTGSPVTCIVQKMTTPQSIPSQTRRTNGAMNESIVPSILSRTHSLELRFGASGTSEAKNYSTEKYDDGKEEDNLDVFPDHIDR